MAVASQQKTVTIAEVNFEVHCETAYGEEVRVIGNLPELGSWSSKQGFRLYTDSEIYPKWRSHEPLKLPQNSEVQLKFAKCNQADGTAQEWEQFPNGLNRKYRIRYKKCTLKCFWNKYEWTADLDLKYSNSSGIPDSAEFPPDSEQEEALENVRKKEISDSFDPFDKADIDSSEESNHSLRFSSGAESDFQSPDINMRGKQNRHDEMVRGMETQSHKKKQKPLTKLIDYDELNQFEDKFENDEESSFSDEIDIKVPRLVYGTKLGLVRSSKNSSSHSSSVEEDTSNEFPSRQIKKIEPDLQFDHTFAASDEEFEHKNSGEQEEQEQMVPKKRSGAFSNNAMPDRNSTEPPKQKQNTQPNTTTNISGGKNDQNQNVTKIRSEATNVISEQEIVSANIKGIQSQNELSRESSTQKLGVIASASSQKYVEDYDLSRGESIVPIDQLYKKHEAAFNARYKNLIGGEESVRQHHLNENVNEFVVESSAEFTAPVNEQDTIIFCSLFLPVRAQYYESQEEWRCEFVDNGNYFQFCDSFRQCYYVGLLPTSARDRSASLQKELSGESPAAVQQSPSREGSEYARSSSSSSFSSTLEPKYMEEETQPDENATPPRCNSEDKLQTMLLEKHRIAAILDEEALSLAEDFIENYNQVLLEPLLNNQLDVETLLQHEELLESGLDSLRRLCRLFVDRILILIDEIREQMENCYLYIMDAKLILLPAAIAARECRLYTLFNCGGKFPELELFKLVPHHEELLNSLLCADVINFPEFEDATYFLYTLKEVLGVCYQSRRGTLYVQYRGRKIVLTMKPNGINLRILQEIGDKTEFQTVCSELQTRYANKITIYSVDYLKTDFESILQKLILIERLLLEKPDLSIHCTMQLITSPHQRCLQNPRLDQFIKFLREQNARINNRFGNVVDIAIDQFTYSHRLAFMQEAHILLLSAKQAASTSLAFEFLSVNENRGACLIDDTTEFAHACSEFFAYTPHCFTSFKEEFNRIIDPKNAEEFGEALERDKQYILEKFEARQQLESIMQELKKISKLQEFYNFLGDETRGYYIKVLHSLSLKALTNLQQISEDYRRAKNRVLLISYNGGLLDARIHEKYFRGRTIATLTRESAGFTNEVCQTLSQLSAQRATTLFLLSELSASFFDSILSPKDALNLKIACENGYRYLNCAETQEEENIEPSTSLPLAPRVLTLQNKLITAPTTSSQPESSCSSSPFSPPKILPWKTLAADSKDWQKIVHGMMQQFTHNTQGSKIFERGMSIIWVYEDVEETFGARQAEVLTKQLTHYAQRTNLLEVFCGRGYIEVRPLTINRVVFSELVLEEVAASKGKIDFIMCIGYGMQNEDLFSFTKQAIRSR